MLTDASRKFHETLDAQKAVRKQGKMNADRCLPEVPQNIGCAEQHRRDADAQKSIAATWMCRTASPRRGCAESNCLRTFAETQNQHEKNQYDKMSAGSLAG